MPHVIEEIESSLGTPEFFANPYPLYHRLRSESPVYWSEKLGGWLLTRYDDCTAALRDYRRVSNRDRMTVLMNPLRALRNSSRILILCIIACARNREEFRS